MLYTFKPHGVCPKELRIKLDENNIIQKLEACGGCSGNLQGIAYLIEGLPAQQVIQKLKGIKCSFKQTSCPDQIAAALEELLARQE